jgi:hypothetical protein
MLIGILEKTAKEIAKGVAKNAAVGGAADGILATVDKKSAGEVVKEIGCGVVTSGGGTAAKEAFDHFTKNGGKWGHIVGITASIGSRYVYRRLFYKQDYEKK